MSDISSPTSTTSRAKWVLLLLILTALCVAGYWGWQYYQHQQNTPPPPALPVFMPLEAFTVNIVGDEDIERVLYIGMTLRLPDEQTRSRFNNYLPEIRSRILLLLSTQNASVLSTQQGKHKLMEDIKAILRPPVIKNQPEQIVNDVLFTDFILR